MKKIEKDIIKVWRLNKLIIIGIMVAIMLVVMLIMVLTGDDKYLYVPPIVCGVVSIWPVLSILFFAKLRWARWGYEITEDRVIIEKGLFFTVRMIVPMIRIQHIAVEKGPITGKYNLRTVSLFLASGSFEIVGLKEDEAENIYNYLKEKIYK